MAQRYRILYVEDQDVWENLLRQHMERINGLGLNRKFDEQLQLVRVDSAQAFISALTTSGPFDLALIDLNLEGPQLTEGAGVDLLKQLKQIGEAPPRIVL